MSVGESTSATLETAAAPVTVTQAVLHETGVTVETPGDPAIVADEATAPTKLPANHPLLRLQEAEAAIRGSNYNDKRFFEYF